MTFTIGFLCEYNNQIVKIYDFKTKLMTHPNTYQGRLQLGDFYKWQSGKIQRLTDDDTRRKEVEVSVSDGQIIVSTWAMYQDADRPKVWSPYLDYLNDPSNLFRSQFGEGEEGWVNVKYAPTANCSFEIVNVRLPNEKDRFLQPKIEVNTHPSKMVIDKSTKMNKTVTAMTLCIQTTRPDMARVDHDSRLRCNDLFSMRFGLVRWNTDRVEHPNQAFGRWFHVEFNDYRVKERNRGKSRYIGAPARRVTEVPEPLRTRIINGKIEIETSFIFDLKNTESNPYSEMNRMEGLNTYPHFWDKYLGRVELDRMDLRIVIDEIERMKQNGTCGEVWEFLVNVHVRVKRDYFKMSHKYPEKGLFFVYNVLQVDPKVNSQV